MEPLFSPWQNTVARLTVLAIPACLIAIPLALMGWVRTPWVNRLGVQVSQPVQFDHRHHVRDDRIPCLYCHHWADRADFAGIPSTDTCMGCHTQIWTGSPLLALVRTSMATGRPIAWRRVHDLPDFAYFSHAPHVTRGVACEVCHGQVGDMAVVAKARSMDMGFCVSCHRDHGAPTHCSVCHR